MKRRTGEAFDPVAVRAERGNQVFVPDPAVPARPQSQVPEMPRLNDAEIAQKQAEIRARYEAAEARRLANEAPSSQNPALSGYRRFGR